MCKILPFPHISSTLPPHQHRTRHILCMLILLPVPTGWCEPSCWCSNCYAIAMCFVSLLWPFLCQCGAWLGLCPKLRVFQNAKCPQISPTTLHHTTQSILRNISETFLHWIQLPTLQAENHDDDWKSQQTNRYRDSFDVNKWESLAIILGSLLN